MISFLRLFWGEQNCFKHFKVSCHCLLDWAIIIKKSTMNSIIVLLKIMNLFPLLTAFKISHLCFLLLLLNERFFKFYNASQFSEVSHTWFCIVVVVQSLSHVQLFVTHGLQHSRLPCPSLSPGVCSNSCPSGWWCYLTISSSAAPSPFTFNLSQHQGLSSELALRIRWPKYQSFSFSISPSNEYSGLISLRIDWLDKGAWWATVHEVEESNMTEQLNTQCLLFS